MKFEVYSVGYSYNKDKMLEYKESLISAGINVCDFICPEPEGDKYWQKKDIYIVVDINSAEDFVKIVETVGTVIFDGGNITIYDGFYE